MSKLPRHIAIVMDGNGRWAKRRNLSRLEGHKAGGEAARKIITKCAEKGIESLTLFAFSTENWARPKTEVTQLMKLFFHALEKNLKDLTENNIRFSAIGNIAALDKKLRLRIAEVEEKTKNNNRLNLNLAVNYGGRWDILNAVQNVALKVKNNELAVNDINDECFQSFLSLSHQPEPDLFIRTSGEQRISNFLLWQLAYAELYFTDCLWPDFAEEELEKALQVFANRERRFGGV